MPAPLLISTLWVSTPAPGPCGFPRGSLSITVLPHDDITKNRFWCSTSILSQSSENPCHISSDRELRAFAIKIFRGLSKLLKGLQSHQCGKVLILWVSGPLQPHPNFLGNEVTLGKPPAEGGAGCPERGISIPEVQVTPALLLLKGPGGWLGHLLG